MNVPIVIKARKPADEPRPRVAVEACFLKSDGSPVDLDAMGGRAAAVAPVASPDAAASAAAPTKAEFDKAVAVANECKRQLNALVSALKAAGLMS